MMTANPKLPVQLAKASSIGFNGPAKKANWRSLPTTTERGHPLQDAMGDTGPLVEWPSTLPEGYRTYRPLRQHTPSRLERTYIEVEKVG